MFAVVMGIVAGAVAYAVLGLVFPSHRENREKNSIREMSRRRARRWARVRLGRCGSNVGHGWCRFSSQHIDLHYNRKHNVCWVSRKDGYNDDC